MSSDPDEDWKTVLLNKEFDEWDTTNGTAGWNDVWIRFIYWYGYPDNNGVRDYWAEWVFVWDSDTPFTTLFRWWIELARPGCEIDDFTFDCPSWETEYIDDDNTPADYHMSEYDTIVVTDLAWESD